MKVVQLNNVKKDFASLKVLKHLNLELDQGEVLGLFGHNGAGKTTTMKLILGLLKPTQGEVRVFGQSPSGSQFNHHRYRLGFLPENVSFYQQLSGIEVLSFFAKLKKVPSKRCDELLQQVGLKEASKRKVKTYSKGMKQRLGLAQAMLTEPSLLLLDEPTVGLDPIATQEFYQSVDDLRNKGCSIILCSHILPGVEKHIDKAAILSQGELCAYGSIDELRDKTRLKSRISFTGCFEIEQLSQQLNHQITGKEDGVFTIELLAKEKMPVIKKLMEQPGLSNLDTSPPSLEQLYRHFNEKSHQIIDFPARNSDPSEHIGGVKR